MTLVPQRRTKKIWTTEEDWMLTEAVKESPNNVKRALRKAAELMNLDFYQCRNRWYGVLNKRIQESMIEEVTGGGSKGEYLPNQPTPSLSAQIADQLDGFMDAMKKLHKHNKELQLTVDKQQQRILEQDRMIRDMKVDQRELEEGYKHVMQVIEKARKMFVEDEQQVVRKVVTDSSGIAQVG